MTDASADRFVPLIVCAEFDSPIDALLSLCVPHDDVMDLVAASWFAEGRNCIAANVDGGRAVAAMRLPDGRWAACNAYPEYGCSTRSEADRRLGKLLKRHRRGGVGVLTKTEWLALLISAQPSAENGPGGHRR